MPNVQGNVEDLNICKTNIDFIHIKTIYDIKYIIFMFRNVSIFVLKVLKGSYK